MKIKHADNDIRFLAGGGEMGKLIREKDWNRTYLVSVHKFKHVDK